MNLVATKKFIDGLTCAAIQKVIKLKEHVLVYAVVSDSNRMFHNVQEAQPAKSVKENLQTRKLQ
jgi:hypothetical protein